MIAKLAGFLCVLIRVHLLHQLPRNLLVQNFPYRQRNDDGVIGFEEAAYVAEGNDGPILKFRIQFLFAFGFGMPEFISTILSQIIAPSTAQYSFANSVVKRVITFPYSM